MRIIAPLLIGWILLMTNAVLAEDRNLLPRCDFKDLWVIPHDQMGPAEQVIAQTLQGLTASSKEHRIWLDAPGVCKIILEQIRYDGVRVHDAKSVWDLVREFRPEIRGVIVYKLGTDSLNVATSLCGPMQGIAVDESLLDQAKAEGLEVIADVRGMDDRTALTRYGHLFKHGVLVSQSAGIASHLRDFAVARHAFAFSNADNDFLTETVRELGPDPLVFGWGREREWVTNISKANGTTVPADWSLNLSVLENLPAGKLKRPVEPPVKTEDNVKYIAFVMSDGDNLQFLENGFFRSTFFWNSPLRGQFPMTWEVPTVMAAFAPRILRYLYDTATPRDGFVTGAGLPGYTYAHWHTDRAALARQGARYMRLSDLSVAGVINADQGKLEDVIPILEQPEVKGVLYKDYSHYDGRHGALMWHKGKPCLSFKFDLRENRQGPEELARQIAAMPASPKTDEGSYAIVTVLAWGYPKAGGPMEAVRRTLELLPKNVRVVTANQLIGLLRGNFSQKHR